MSIVRQPAYIAKSPISIAIGGTVPAPFPPTPVVPAQDLQINGVLTGTGSGKWVSAIEYYFGSLNGPTTFTFSDLEGTTGGFFNSNAPTTSTSVSAPNLIYVGSNLFAGGGVFTYSNLTSINFPKLQYIGGSLLGSPNTYPALTSISFPELVFIGSPWGGNLAGSTSIDVPKLQIMSGMNFTANSLTSLNLSSLAFCSGNLSFTAPALTTLTMPSVLGTWKAMLGMVNLTNIALNQTSVNNLLAALAYMDGNNGTLLFGTGRAVTITGTSSAPSNLGVVTGLNGSQFVGAGTICTATIANHGYAIGDMIRVAGVGAPLVNANRYAAILPTDFTTGSFKYNIASQTGTGTGTGTVSVTKAGPSAAALVTRGVTLTTN
jgi:hypothetical protein